MGGILVHDTGIVDYKQVCARLVNNLQERGCEIMTGVRVHGLIEQPGAVTVRTNGEELQAQVVVNCAGLHSDRVAKLGDSRAPAAIIPFRGEYYALKPEVQHLCRNLIYPVPDPQFPFLGVHFTRMIDGGVECGPNAVLAFAREGYRKTDLNLRDLAEIVATPGFFHLARRHWRMGMGEMWRSWNKAAFVRALQRLMPEITAEHQDPAPAGVRAQAITPDGKLLDDFACDCGYITAQQHRELTGLCQEVGKMLGSIINNPTPSCSLPPDLCPLTSDPLPPDAFALTARFGYTER